MRLAGGAPIFAEGEPAEHLANVVAGAVRLSKLLPDGRRQVTGFLFPGDFLGIAGGATYAFTAEAVTAVELCRFPRRAFEGLMAEIPRLEHALLGLAAHELAAAQDQMLLLGRKTARERVASFLLTLSRRAERRGEPPSPVHLPMSRSDIGDHLGLTAETVSRAMMALKAARTIRLLPGDRVALVDRRALKESADGG